MAEFKIQRKVSAHKSSITKLLLNPYEPRQIISIGLDGHLNIWKLPNLDLQKSIKLKVPHITSIAEFSNSQSRGFLVGSGNGYLLLLDQKFETKKISKIHEDCLSQIIVNNLYVITVGYDGKVIFFNKESFQIHLDLNLEHPLLSAIQYDSCLYIASSSDVSFVINLNSFEAKQSRKRYNGFFAGNERIFGCSDDKGLTSLHKNSNTYVPCEFVTLYKRQLLLFSQKSICRLNYMDTMQWKAQKYDILSTGESIKGAVVFGNYIYAGGDEGNIYWIKDLTAPNQCE